MRRLLLALLLLAAPLQGLHSQEIDAEAGLWVSGPIVPEVSHRVRLGNMGQEMYGAVQISDWLSDHWRVGGDILVAPAHLYVYPATEDNDGWFSRPHGATHRESVVWACTTLGAWYDRGWIATGAGLGMCHLTNLDHGFFGAGPMHSVSSRVGLTLSKDVTESMSANLRCRVHPSPVRGEDYTVLQIASGRLEPGEHDSGEWTWNISGGCGLGLSIAIGGER